ncbi:signal protein [Streptomyces griseoincarnatus]|uniref:Signal protein n=1 Tax=Streptomyces griseoincarnatus TaxID=29305 RepID=A0ABT0VUX6_STRGI|nr:signal protein [Streptomyces griseoincarnatus]MCM2515152.1 signal protein [Streptomyces griseoincarnatus]
MRITTAGAGIAAVALVATLAGCGGRAATAEGRLSSEELQGRWWTWASTEPAPTNPVGDEDGSACGRNQPEDVWFLAGTFGTQAERTCAVPEGVPLAFPLVNMFGTPADCADFMSTAEGSAVLDGEKVDADAHQAESVEIRSGAGNPVTGTDGSFSAHGCGLWVQLPAPEPGEHSLEIRGRSGGFSVGVDYNLTVGAA